MAVQPVLMPLLRPLSDWRGFSKWEAAAALRLGDKSFFMAMSWVPANFKPLTPAMNGATVFRYGSRRFLSAMASSKFACDDVSLSNRRKNRKAKSRYAITGLYVYDTPVVETSKQVKPSGRANWKCTDLKSPIPG